VENHFWFVILSEVLFEGNKHLGCINWDPETSSGWHNL